MNGGVYMDSTAAVTMNRLGVEQITLPTPERTGYIFKGWKSPNGKLYNKTLTNVFDEELFKDTTLTADWAEIEAESIALVVSNRLGLHTQDFNMAYITKWADGEIEKFKSNVDVIRSVSYQILSSVEPAVQSAIRDKEKALESQVQAVESTSNEDKANTQENTNEAVNEPAGEPKAEEKPKTRKTTKSKTKEVEQC